MSEECLFLIYQFAALDSEFELMVETLLPVATGTGGTIHQSAQFPPAEA